MTNLEDDKSDDLTEEDCNSTVAEVALGRLAKSIGGKSVCHTSFKGCLPCLQILTGNTDTLP